MQLNRLKHHSIDRKVAGLIPRQGTCPGCGFDPQMERVHEGNQSMFLFHIDVSLSLALSLFLSPPPSLKTMMKYPQVRINKKRIKIKNIETYLVVFHHTFWKLQSMLL